MGDLTTHFSINRYESCRVMGAHDSGMKRPMARDGKNHKIFNSIIIFYMINVMYHFIFRQRSSQMFFHNNPLLCDISLFSGFWVFWHIYIKITIPVDKWFSIRNACTLIGAI